ncbi:MAG TPA: Gfo/Idh/MocA family oxidoreductase [Burkholderiales bacterium]|jgi:predicted dehydrogenase|nr:Gfo/Idh/MocA family oxidoreductase [Burkholderiales bacterium]
MQERLRVGFAGAGAISQYHLAGWSQTPEAEVVALCDVDESRARAKAAEFGIAKVHTDFRAMIEAERLDAVDIVTPVGTHAPLTRMAADAGLHVCCQKPLTPTVREARELIDYVGDRVRFMVHENYRFRPHYLQIADWLRQGRIGEVTHARMVVRSQGMITVGDTPPFILKRQPYLRDFRRLLVFEVLIHHLDVLRVLLGPLKVVSARTAKVNPELAGEDVAVVLLEDARGMTVVMDGNTSAPGYPPLPMDRLEVMGTRGSLVFERDTLSLVGSNEPPVVFDLAKNYQACFTRAVQEFVKGVRQGTPFPTDRLDNLETLKLMEDCYVAAGVAV